MNDGLTEFSNRSLDIEGKVYCRVDCKKLKQFIEERADGKLIYWKLERGVAKRYLKSNDKLLEEFRLY